jgi:hypothetical protein
VSHHSHLRPAILWVAAWETMLCLAQAPVGSISGIVHDQSGGVMQTTSVIVENEDTGFVRKAVTAADGAFAVPSLPAGEYRVKASASGFRTLVENVTVQVGRTTTVELAMQVGAASEIFNVRGDAQIDFESHAVAGLIPRERIENLPLNGRSFLQLAGLEPGVTVSTNGFGQANRQFSVNIMGADSSLNSLRITVDGANIADAGSGGTQQNFSQEVVQEFQLSAANFDLSTGIGAGGALNIVTRSGSNDFQGSAFFYFRDHNMSAYPYLQRDPHEPASPFFARRQTGYEVGGPIKKDTLFFFSSLEHTNQTGVFSSFASNPLFGNFAANAPSPFHENEIGERLDFRIGAKHNAFLRYSHDGNNTYAPHATGGLPSDWDVNVNYSDSGVVSLVSVLSPSTVNEFRYSMAYWSNTNNPPTASECPAPCLGLGLPNIQIRGVANFVIGNSSNVPQNRLSRRYTYDDNVSKQKGPHATKFGGYWEHLHGTGTFASAYPAAAALYSPGEVQLFNSHVPPGARISIPSTFKSLDDLLRLPVFRFSTGVGDVNLPPLGYTGTAGHDNLFHIYWQDHWRIHPRLSLNWGVAWSYESNALNYDLTKPEYLAPIFGANGLGSARHSPHDFSPMLGFAWAATKDNKTVVRGGAGIYYDTLNLDLRSVELGLLGPVGTGRVVLGDSFFFQTIAQRNGFASLPPPLQPTSLSTQPTTFTAAELVHLLPQFYSDAQQLLSPAGDSSLGIRNINVLKTGTGLLERNFRPPYGEHASIGVEREIGSDWMIVANFVFRQFLHQMIHDSDLNRYYSASGPVIPACHGTQQQDPAAQCSEGVIQGIISGARSHYEGLLVKVDKRLSRRTTGTLSYAYANQIGYNGLIDDSNWLASWGPQAGHQILTGSIVIDFPRGFQVGGITSFQSAGPFQPILAGIDLNGNGAVRAGETGGAPLPDGGYNQFGVSMGTSNLIQLVNHFNQNYAGTKDAFGNTIGCPDPNARGTLGPCLLPSGFSLPRGFHSQDFRLTKVFRLHAERLRLSVFGECFNIFNIANLSGYSSSLNSPGFGKPTQRTLNVFGSGGPRAFQSGARLTF